MSRYVRERQTSADLETKISVISRMWLLLKAGFWGESDGDEREEEM